MRSDMSRVIVERPRRGGIYRRGRDLPLDEQPFREGMRRRHFERGQAKELNENLAPLRRYLECQVGRPWNKVYAEIAAHLRADNAVQQHVRDHIRDFVAIKPRRVSRTYFTYPTGEKERRERLWYQPLYVDERDGILKRTDRLPEVKTRKRRERQRPSPPPDRLALGPDRELRRIEGFWYELRLAPMPDPIYRPVVERQKIPLKPFYSSSKLVEMDVTVRRLASVSVYDVVLGRDIDVGPKIDKPAGWREYRRRHSDRRYVIGKRRLCKAELRQHHLQDQALDKIALAVSKPEPLTAKWRHSR
jgi:hypothetical protein